MTLVAVFTFIAGTRIPLPGLDLDALGPILDPPTGGLVMDRFSIMSLGIMPLLNALLLAEMFLLLIPPLRRWHNASAGANRSWNRGVLALSLAFALFQAYGMATALESFPGLVEEPQDSFFSTAVLTLLAGSLLAVWLSHLIDRQGIGNGIWVMFLVPALTLLPQKFATLMWLVESGAIRNDYAIASPAAAMVTIAGVSALLTNRERANKGGIERIVWPLMLGGVASGWIWTAYILARHGGELPVSETPGQIAPLSPYAVCLLIFGFAFIYAWRTEAMATAVKSALWLALAASLPALAAHEFHVPVLMEGTTLAILAAVVFSAMPVAPKKDADTA